MSNAKHHSIVEQAYIARGKYFEPPPGDMGRAFLEIARTGNPELHVKLDHGLSVLEDALQHFAGQGDLNLINALIELGVNINAKLRGSERTALDNAASFANVEAVRWLVEHGATINTEVEGSLGSFSLMGAVCSNKKDVAEYLFEQGAIVNFVNRSGLSPLDYATDIELKQWLLSIGAKSGSDLARDNITQNPTDTTSIATHLASLGLEVREVPLHDILPGGPSLRILSFVLTDENRQCVCTDGMSQQLQATPLQSDSHLSVRRTELCCFLPIDWPIDQRSLEEGIHRWPIDWMRTIARWPFENNTYLRRATIFANGNPPQPLSSATGMTCVMVVAGAGDWLTWERPDGETVEMMMLSPLYTEERDFERQYGMEELLKRLSFHSTTFCLTRDSVVN
jgi:hypothetical protein